VVSLKELASRYDTDKASNPAYLRDFEEVFGALRERRIALLELGVLRGGSLQMWRDYFPAAKIVGLDINEVRVGDESGRIRTYCGRQDDTRLLDRIRATEAPGEPTRTSFWHLLQRHLNPGGIYCIEDWGTGYWPSWPDGHRIGAGGSLGVRRRLHRLAVSVSASAAFQRNPAARRAAMRLERALVPRRFPSHDFGMVGFVKELIDECGIGDATAPRRGIGEFRPSMFSRLQVSQGHVFVFKAAGAMPLHADGSRSTE
jgi:hypothetical protein